MRKRVHNAHSSQYSQPLKLFAQPASVSISALISALPLDVLTHLFAFIVLRPRLRAVSLVCKRWRTAVVRSVDRLPLLQRRPVARCLALFPNLRALGIHCDGTFAASLTLPPNTQSFILRGCYLAHCKSACLQLIASCQSSLAHLSLVNCESPPPGMHLPALSSLDVSRVLVDSSPVDFISVHASQLTHLASAWWPSLHDVSFPHLRSLHLGDPSYVRQLPRGPAGWFADTALVPTHVTVVPTLAMLHSLGKDITTLNLKLPFDSRTVKDCDVLAALESISTLPLSFVLTTLTLVTNDRTFLQSPAIGSLPALTSLTTDILLDVPASILAQLTSLTLRAVPIHAVMCYLAQCPKLRTFEMGGLPPPAEISTEILRRCEQLGLESVTGPFTNTTHKPSAWVAVKYRAARLN